MWRMCRAVQDVGGAGMLLVNSDESLIPLMTETKELEGLVIWGARWVSFHVLVLCAQELTIFLYYFASSRTIPFAGYPLTDSIATGSIGLQNGTTILNVLAKSKNLPTLVKVAPREDGNETAATSN
ncbi:hypothetical protein ON010_g10089 [Phytophthora cinnamomi]|nr:hypothetical protein ON010_g10089 [Phytophthora cinnamomi]